MLKISGPVGATVFATAILLSGAGADVAIDSAYAENTPAHADNCLAGPKGASPAGQHWYYRLERGTKRKCWYLHATEQVEHRSVVKHHAAAPAGANAAPAPGPQIAAAPAASAAAPADANTEPAPEPQIAADPAVAAADPVVAAAATPFPVPAVTSPAAPVPAPDSAAGDAPRSPRITMLAVRTSTPFVGTAAISPQNTPEQPAAAPAPQTLPRDAVAPAMDGAKPPSESAGAEPQDKADTASKAPAQTADAAAVDAKTKTAEMFILLAFVFGIAAALIGVVGKIAGIYRKPRITVDSDDAWMDDQYIDDRYEDDRYEARQRIDAEAGHNEQDVPFVDPQEHYGLADLHAEEWRNRYRAPDRSNRYTAQDRYAVPPAGNEDATQSPEPDQTDIQMALRFLRQARQSRVA